jgi:Tol biopolymer transport system component
MDLKSGHRRKLLPEFVMQHYSVSGDGRKVVFIRADHNRSPVWIAMLDGSSPPHALASIDGVSAFFAGGDSVVFHSTGENSSDLVYRVHQDGSGLERLLSSPVIALYGVSPDRKWVAAWIAGSSSETRNSVVAIPIDGGTPVMICPGCGTAGAQRRGHTPPSVSWSPDQKFFYLVFKETPLNLYAIPLRDGQALPALPRSGIRSVADIEALPGVRLVSESQAFAGPNPGLFAYTKVSTQRNIYRIGLP